MGLPARGPADAKASAGRAGIEALRFQMQDFRFQSSAARLDSLLAGTVPQAEMDATRLAGDKAAARCRTPKLERLFCIRGNA